MKIQFIFILSLILTFSFNYAYAFDEPRTNILLNFDFINPVKKNVQEHVDYKITISNDESNVFGPSPLTHSKTGEVSIPLKFALGKEYTVKIEVYGILFNTIPMEEVSFNVMNPSKDSQRQFTSNNTLKVGLAINKDPFGEPKVVPEWVKTNTKWWTDGQIDDSSFILGMQYLIKEKIIDIPKLPYPASWMDKSVPSWVKNTASWWADDLVPEDDFIKGIKHLVEKGIIQV